MYRIAAAALLALAACAAPPGSARDPQAPLRSVVVAPERLAGAWRQIAGTPACPPTRIAFTQAGGGLTAEGAFCGARLRGPVTLAGPGRLRIAPLAEPLWIVWVDADYRTLAIGTPSGRIGAILDRTPASSPDRLRAARDILAWNGYDLSALN